MSIVSMERAVLARLHHALEIVGGDPVEFRTAGSRPARSRPMGPRRRTGNTRSSRSGRRRRLRSCVGMLFAMDCRPLSGAIHRAIHSLVPECRRASQPVQPSAGQGNADLRWASRGSAKPALSTPSPTVGRYASSIEFHESDRRHGHLKRIEVCTRYFQRNPIGPEQRLVNRL